MDDIVHPIPRPAVRAAAALCEALIDALGTVLPPPARRTYSARHLAALRHAWRDRPEWTSDTAMLARAQDLVDELFTELDGDEASWSPGAAIERLELLCGALVTAGLVNRNMHTDAVDGECCR